jgi:hypothetical protein
VHGFSEGVVLSRTDGTSPSPIKGLEPRFQIFQWSSDARWLYVGPRGELPQRVYRFDLQAGSMELWRELMPADRAGVIRLNGVMITPGGEAYAYEVVRVTASDLYILDGLF